LANPYPVDLPPSARRLTIDTRSGPLAALDARPSHGSPIRGLAVMVPGFTGSKEDFIPMLAPLVSAGFRVVCFDQRGQYESPGPAHANAYSIEVFAADLLTVIRTVADGQAVHLLGHSFGGLVARRAVIARPVAVRSLTLLDSGPDGPSLSRSRMLGVLGWVIRLGGSRMLAAGSVVAAFTGSVVAAFAARLGPWSGASAERLRWLRHRWAKTSRAGLVGMLGALAAEPDLVADLEATAVPVLVMYGNSDNNCPPATQMGMARRLKARLEIINDAGHTPTEDQPEVTARNLVEFWTAVDSRHRPA
jgi:pimeloyl-ACP methyl ester carboxylesterase